MAKKKSPKSPEQALAARIAKKLGAIDGVVAVALGGSRARGRADRHSDVDLGIYYRAEAKPAIRLLRELADSLDDGTPLAVTDFGDWGPWINGGAWLTVDGTRVDWLYRELGHVVATIGECRAGRVSCDYQAGHPHGFHNHAYMGEVAYLEPLHDPTKVLAQLKALASAYPPALRKAIADRYLWEAGFTFETAEKPAKRGDVAYVTGALFRAAASLVQVVFALEGRYFVNEKGSVAEAGEMDAAPKGFAKTIEAILAAPGSTPAKLQASIERMHALYEAFGKS